MSAETSFRAEVEELFKLSVDMLCIAGTDGRFKHINPAFERVPGWSEEELLSRPFFDFVHKDDLEATQVELRKQSEGGTRIPFENRYRFAAAERYLNRVWSASTDGYIDEAHTYLGRSREQFDEARKILDRLVSNADSATSATP